MEILNTLTNQKEEFVPLDDKRINMFVCGPTVYDYIHIGNARTFVFFDVVAKYLKYKFGEDKVTYIQNITDIDNKIINRAQQENKTCKEIADFYFIKFKEDMKALGVTSPKYARATDYIEEVKKQIKNLKSKGNVYLIENDGWYFDLKTFPEYGKLSGRTAEMADDAVSRIDESEKKRNKGDFCVWKLVDKLETGYWDDKELGYGRPGWHIEDTAITEKEFGPQYDIHGGGQDLIFPHHEAEIAQQSAAAGIKSEDFVKIWMHVGFLVSLLKKREEYGEYAKMSKSLGNFTTIRELFDKYSQSMPKYLKQIIRYYLLVNAHYKATLIIEDGSLKQSETAIKNFEEVLNRMRLAKKQITLHNKSSFEQKTKDCKKAFYEALDEDFNIPKAMGILSSFVSEVNQAIDLKQIGIYNIDEALDLFKKVNKLLDIIPIDSVPENILREAEKIDELREKKDFKTSDEIRRKIEAQNYKVSSSQLGTTVIAGIIIKNIEDNQPTK